MHTFVFLLLIFSNIISQAKISFTFDDGITDNQVGYSFQEWNKMLLNKLDSFNIQSIFFVTGKNKTDEKGQFLLKSWDEKGHSIANHSYSHPYYNSKKITINDLKDEVLKTDQIISSYKNYIRLFRFPYLKEGNTPEKVKSFREFLKEKDYRNGYVTIDASDWYINNRLKKRLKRNPNADLKPYRDYYLKHIYDRAKYYEDLSFELNKRHINHTLLLHHNLLSALFIDDLISMFIEKGWKIINAKDAYLDPIFIKPPIYAGESLIWALAKDTENYDDTLRYPAEGSRYEKNKMDKLGL